MPTAKMTGKELVAHLMETKFDNEYQNIPMITRFALCRYAVYGSHPGSGIHAVITNDLRGAIAHLDEQNQSILKILVLWFYWQVPSNCQGSPEKFNEWKGMIHG